MTKKHTDFYSLLDYFLKIEDLPAERRALLRDYSLAHYQAFGAAPDLGGYKRAPSVKVRAEIEALQDIADATTATTATTDHKPTVQDLSDVDFNSRFKPLWWEMGGDADGWYWHDDANVVGPFDCEESAQKSVESIAGLLVQVIISR